ncbi:MAG TPA: Trk system potassium transporter TrkA, partial [Bacillota bacterium]|nr:Trk system potassium transporter TrkA [Bacillota bacterium]
MKIIIIGAGKVGYSLAESLSKSNHDVTIIDRSPIALGKAEENLEVLCIRGSGVSTGILMEAEIGTADLLIAVTNSDEVNMVCCLTAKKLGVKQTIARIRDPEYANELSILKEELELDLIINPEQTAAEEIVNVLNFPIAVNVENFAKGRVKMVEIKATEDMEVIGKPLKDIGSKLMSSVLIGVVVRNNEVIIPNGEFIIQENDNMYVIGKPSSLYSFCMLSGKAPHKIRNVMIEGGGRISIYLANLLTEMGIKVKLIEIDKEKCVRLSELLPGAL